MKYNNQIKPTQIISVISFLIGIAFLNTVLLIGSVDNWVCYLGGIYSLLFILSAPAYFLEWNWSKYTLIIAYFLFIGYNIYNTITGVLDGGHGIFVGVPISITSVCIILYILKAYKRIFTFFNLFLISILSHWLWLFFELLNIYIKDNFKSNYLLIGLVWFLILSLVTILLLYKKNFIRIFLSVLLHIQLIIFFCIEAAALIAGDIGNWGLGILLTLLNLIVILCLHNKRILNEATNKSDCRDCVQLCDLE